MAKPLYYIRRQTNAGPNQGKWLVTSDEGGTVVLGLEKWRAVWICAAFNLAHEHPEHGQAIRSQAHWETGTVWGNQPTYVRRKRR